MCIEQRDVLKKTESVSIHQRKLKLLATEIFKTQNNLNTSFMKQIFVQKDVPYHLRCCRNAFAPRPKTTKCMFSWIQDMACYAILCKRVPDS